MGGNGLTGDSKLSDVETGASSSGIRGKVKKSGVLISSRGIGAFKYTWEEDWW